ncbi:MAG: mandelate racemase [Ectothiorhodospiraceae bacterium]|nr:mandelate racemase [Ectothiorhodospiraceae bacterium]
MRITEIRELAVPLEGSIANAAVSFDDHDVSLVALVSDRMRGGRPLIGLAFNSIGRFAQGGILRARMIPRVLAADPASLLDPATGALDPAALLRTAMRNEKPGGHGDRAGAAAAIELAAWDLLAKAADEPAYATIARAHGRAPRAAPVEVYAAGGYYYPRGAGRTLADELRGYRDMGFTAFKMKIGGAPLADDLRRVESALAVAGDGARLAVDANGRFGLETALACAQALAPFGLRWLEEMGDPLDYALNRRLVEAYAGPVATGENLFSTIDVENLLRYGGVRPGHDVVQVDPGLAYGITELARILRMLEALGFDRRQVHPHGGHLVNLHIVTALGLGGCEAYPGVFRPFGGYSEDCVLGAGTVRAGDAPGFGLERKRELADAIARITA